MFRASLRRAFSMTTSTASSPFTKAVVASLRKLYPESLADKSFDNTGLLLEAPFDPIRRQMNSVLLTVDLTKSVADEAIDRNDCVVVAYHPIIFRGLKSLTLDDPQQQSLLRLALEGISVYSPHTAVDAVPGGMADWLCDIITGQLDEPPPAEEESEEEDAEEKAEELQEDGQSAPAPPSKEIDDPLKKRPLLSIRPNGNTAERQYSSPTYPVLATLKQTTENPNTTPHIRQTIHPHPNPLPDFPSAGFGRLVTFSEPQPLGHLLDRIARGVGNPAGFPVAIPQNRSVEDLTIRTVGICPGSGGSVLRDTKTKLDLIFTGELSHHEALAAIERGTAVVTLFHSNTERGYLHQVMKAQLEDTIKDEWKRVREEYRQTEDIPEEVEDALKDEDVNVSVSEKDRDPYGIVIFKEVKHKGKKG